MCSILHRVKSELRNTVQQTHLVVYATGVVIFIQLHSTDFILFPLISLLLHNFHCTQLFFARGAILLVIELAPSMEDEDEAVYRFAEVVLSIGPPFPVMEQTFRFRCVIAFRLLHFA